MRKLVMIGIVAVGLLGILMPEVETLAEEARIKSKGNIEGVINFYSDDIIYLQNEINKLLNECQEEKINE